MEITTPPKTVKELLRRANGLAGLTLEEVSLECGLPLAANQRHAKGVTGQLSEMLLGSDAGNASRPDFTALNIELKTLPVSPSGKVLETTFVCNIPLLTLHQQVWQTSTVYQKLQQVLWLPIICPTNQAYHQRRFGTPQLWSPTPDDYQHLQQDWEELSLMIVTGRVADVTAEYGDYLQIRPKGANAKSLVWGRDESGNKIRTLPRGFYLRTCFTQRIVDAFYHCQLVNLIDES